MEKAIGYITKAVSILTQLLITFFVLGLVVTVIFPTTAGALNVNKGLQTFLSELTGFAGFLAIVFLIVIYGYIQNKQSD
jgi:hypothetical protein